MKNSLKISKVIKPFKKTLKIEGDKSISIRWALLASYRVMCAGLLVLGGVHGVKGRAIDWASWVVRATV